MAAEEFHYFAYGSNMLRQWLAARCPSSKVIGTAWIENYKLTFSKPSTDGSGKATLEPSQGGIVHGVLYTIAMAEKLKLNDVEKGYDGKDNITVMRTGQTQVKVRTYFAQKHDPERVPYDWYLGLIRAGAEQNQLPDACRNTLDAIATKADTLINRQTRQDAIKALRDAGFTEIAESCG